MTAVRIESASTLDVDTCRRLVLGNEPWITLQYGEADVQRIVGAVTRSNLFVARAADRIVGFALSTEGFLLGEYLTLLAVDRTVHRQGIGRQLMAALEDHAFATWPNVYLCVSDFNHRARHFYRQLGYEEVGLLRDLLVVGAAEVLMRKTVGVWRGYRAATGTRA